MRTLTEKDIWALDLEISTLWGTMLRNIEKTPEVDRQQILLAVKHNRGQNFTYVRRAK